MKKIRPVIILILIAAMVFSLAACGSKNGKGDDKTAPGEQSQNTDGGTEPEHEPGGDPGSKQDAEPEKKPEPEKETEPEKGSESEKDTEKEPESEKEEGSEPEKEPEPEEEEDPLPGPDLSGDYYGEFSSDTGTSLDLIVRWAAEPESDGSYTVTLGFYLDSYSLEVGDRDSNKLSVTTASGTQEFTFSTGAVEKKSDEKGESFLGGASIRLSAEEFAAGAETTATWDFRGSYSGKDLPAVTAAGTIIAD